ncbi:hypothetical protein Bca4012_043861 [Brassica carinata]
MDHLARNPCRDFLANPIPPRSSRVSNWRPWVVVREKRSVLPLGHLTWPSGSTECFSHTTTRGRQFDTQGQRGGTGLAKKSLLIFLTRWTFGVNSVTIKSSTYTV